MTFWYNTHLYASEVVFGGVPSSNYYRDSLVVLPQSENPPKSNAWTVDLDNVWLISNSADADKITIRASGSRFAQFDTAYQYIMVPLSDYSHFVTNLKNYEDEFNCNLFSVNHCQAPRACSYYLSLSTLPTLSFKFDQIEFRIPPQGYVLTPDATKGPCDIGVTQLQSSQYILGDIFFRNFAVSFDYQSNTITLGVNANAPVGTEIIQHQTPWLWIILGSLGS